jgi:hypothetical protein
VGFVYGYMMLNWEGALVYQVRHHHQQQRPNVFFVLHAERFESILSVRWAHILRPIVPKLYPCPAHCLQVAFCSNVVPAKLALYQIGSFKCLLPAQLTLSK